MVNMEKFLEKPEVKDLLEVLSKKKFFTNLDHVPNEISEFNNVKDYGPFKAQYAKYAYENWNPKAGDVIIATYPKCGTHWMMQIVRSLLYTEEQYKFMMNYAVLDQGPVEMFKLFDQLEFPTVLCTHQPDFNLNIDRYGELGAKVIYVYRNPKDVAVSFYHFHKNFPKGLVKDEKLFNMDWETLFASFMDGTMSGMVRPGQMYFDHLLGYYNQRHKSNVLFLSYESMKQDTEAAIRKIVSFLELEKTDDEIKFVLEKSSMKSMKKLQEDTAMFKSVNMMRKGIVGDWKNYFTVAQSEAVDALAKKKLQGTDIKFVYSQ